MSITQTFIVTMTGSLGAKKFVIDGVQQPTINLVKGGLYYFDVSDSSNTDQALRFSSTENGTHNSGTVYTTGVSHNLGGGNPGAYVQLQLASDAPDPLYYFDINAGTNAGGQINTLEGSSYGTLSWNSNSWGSIAVPQLLTGQSATTSVGSLEAFNEEGWGRQEWGNSGWGVEYAVQPTGVQSTTSVGSVTAFDTQTVIPTGLELTSSLGSLTLAIESIVTPAGVQAQTQLGDFDNAGTLVGWGRNGWGEEPYGDSFNKLVQLSGLTTLSSSVGSLTLDLQSVVSPTGVSATSSVGSLSFVIDSTPVITGVSATSNVGSISPADVMGLTGVSATSTVGGIILDALTEQPTGQEATTAVGDLTVGIGVVPTGVSATSSVGSLTVGIGVPLSGVSATSATGTISPTPMTIGLTGQEATASVNADGLILRYYGKLDPKTSTGYTTQNPKTSVSGYSTQTPKTSTGYTTKTA